MITAKRERQLSRLRVRSDDFGDRLADAGYAPRVLEHADGRVIDELAADLVELVVPVKLHVPTKGFELLGETSMNEMDRALIDAGLRLQ